MQLGLLQELFSHGVRSILKENGQLRGATGATSHPQDATDGKCHKNRTLFV